MIIEIIGKTGVRILDFCSGLPRGTTWYTIDISKCNNNNNNKIIYLLCTDGVLMYIYNIHNCNSHAQLVPRMIHCDHVTW